MPARGLGRRMDRQACQMRREAQGRRAIPSIVNFRRSAGSGSSRLIFERCGFPWAESR